MSLSCLHRRSEGEERNGRRTESFRLAPILAPAPLKSPPFPLFFFFFKCTSGFLERKGKAERGGDILGCSTHPFIRWSTPVRAPTGDQPRSLGESGGYSKPLSDPARALTSSPLPSLLYRDASTEAPGKCLELVLPMAGSPDCLVLIHTPSPGCTWPSSGTPRSGSPGNPARACWEASGLSCSSAALKFINTPPRSLGL